VTGAIVVCGVIGAARCRVLHPRSPGLPAASSLAGWAADHSRDADGRRPGPISPFRRGRRSHRDRARRRRRWAGLHQSVGRDAGSASEWCTRNCSAGPSRLTSTTRQALPRPGTRAPSSLSARSPEPDQGRPGETRSNDSPPGGPLVVTPGLGHRPVDRSGVLRCRRLPRPHGDRAISGAAGGSNRVSRHERRGRAIGLPLPAASPGPDQCSSFSC
jgi:hypothetical protein